LRRSHRDERPLSQVPRALVFAFALFLAAQAGLSVLKERFASAADSLPPAPRPEVLRAVALGESALAARTAMLYVQAFEFRGSDRGETRLVDFQRLIEWLRSAMKTDPRSEYALFAAARLYAEHPDPMRSRAMLAFLREAFLEDPNRRWPWLAHGAIVAKHRLKDLPLARSFAADVARLATSDAVPDWARQMEVFILEDMNELEAARILLGGMLVTGRIKDPSERRFLEQKLEELQVRTDKR
jgi:hypothetical protein